MSRAIKKAEFCSSINKADPIFTNGVQKTRVISAKTLSYAWTKLNGKMTSKETLSGKWIDDNIKSEEIYLLDSVTYHTSQVGGSHLDILEYSYYMYIYAERDRESASARASWAPAKHNRDRDVPCAIFRCIYTDTNAIKGKLTDTVKAAHVKKDRRTLSLVNSFYFFLPIKATFLN